MRIGQNSQYLNQYNKLGANSKVFSKNLFADFSEETDNTLENPTSFNFTGVNRNMIFQLGAGGNKKFISNEDAVENEILTENENIKDLEDLEAIEAIENEAIERDVKKWNQMNNLLEKLGINGKLVEHRWQGVPQEYSAYYIKMENSDKNMIVFEFENGEMDFIETDLSQKEIQNLELAAKRALGVNSKFDSKLSVAELKKAVAKFFNVDTLKDFLFEFLDEDTIKDFISKYSAEYAEKYTVLKSSNKDELKDFILKYSDRNTLKEFILKSKDEDKII